MSLNDSLFGEEALRWHEYWLILKEQEQQEKNNEEKNNRLSDTVHKQSTGS